MYVCFLVLRFCLSPMCIHVCYIAIYNYYGSYLVPCLVQNYLSKFFVTTHLYTYIYMLYGNIGILWFVLVTVLRNYVSIYIHMLYGNIGILWFVPRSAGGISGDLYSGPCVPKCGYCFS